MLYLGFNILPRSVFWSADLNGRSDNTDVIRLNQLLRFSIRTILLLTLLVSLFVVGYLWVTGPFVLTTGMEQFAVIDTLKRANAQDLVEQKIYSKYHVYVPTGDPEIDDAANAEFEREMDIPYSDDNLNRYWYHPSIGRFETRFHNGVLESIIRWSGTKDKPLDRLEIDTEFAG